MPPAVGQRYNGYQAYLRYKAIMDMIATKTEFTRADMAAVTDVTYDNTLHVANTLVQEGVIKICRFDISSGHRKAVYKEIPGHD